MQTRAAIDSLFNGGEGGITRRSAPRPFGAALTGVIPASSLPPAAYRRKYSLPSGGEGGIRTLEHLLGCYSLSRRAPSTTRPPLHASPNVPPGPRAFLS